LIVTNLKRLIQFGELLRDDLVIYFANKSATDIPIALLTTLQQFAELLGAAKTEQGVDAKLLALAFEYRDLLRCTAEAPESIAELRRVEKVIAIATGGTLPFDETSSQPDGPGNSTDSRPQSGRRGASGSGG
jgi:hypothetical protein